MTKQEYNETYKNYEKRLLEAHKTNDRILIGALLNWMRDNRKHISLMDGYNNIYDYAKDMLGYKKTVTCNCISVTQRFGELDETGMPTGVLKVKYRKYDFCQLIEMRQLDEKTLKSVTPDMSVRQIKALYMPAKEKTVPQQIAEAASRMDPRDQEKLLKIAQALLDCQTVAA